jgi:hypothetical protein
MFWPAGPDNIIKVAAAETDDHRTRYSSRGGPADNPALGD